MDAAVEVTIRDMVEGDRAAALALNNAAVPAVNGHDDGSWDALLAIVDRAWVADVDGAVGALLVTFGPGATYDSANYCWLSDRYDDFRYVDRIVVGPVFRRLGLGARLYDKLAAHARRVGAARLLCEVNVDPPNPASMAFHAAAGWEPIDDLEHGPGKVVRFFQRPLS